MSSAFTEQELEQIANQLGKPQGADGIITAGRMAHTNNNMTQNTIAALELVEGDVVLEVGPGNGTHVKHLMGLAPGLRYYGVDISDLMVTEATKINEADVKSGSASFELTPANRLNFKTDFFDKIFTVNTLYFWEDPKAYAEEIRRVLKPGGIFCLAIATKEFMEGLPFTKYKFKLYDVQSVETLIREAGFAIADILLQKDLTTSHTGQAVDRDIIIVRAKKV
uniref:class I SAM-dependent methyltransferase n=1 Tax=Pedobacter schmidteae TaxID=2201271 RepID=UPI000EB110D6|nr:class I SAM-dependent methyltransferase [Pedobacter schmidteae]